MLIRKLKNCKEIIAGDGCFLRELINANKDNVSLRYSLAHAQIKPNSKTLPHKLKTSELYYILSGKGIMHIDEQIRQVEQHDAIYIPPNAVQYIENAGDEELVFLAIVDPAWKAEDEVVLR